MANTSVTTTAFDRRATKAALLGQAAANCYVAPLSTAITPTKSTTLAECLAAECTVAGARVDVTITNTDGVCTTSSAKFTAAEAVTIYGYFLATDDGTLVAVTKLELPRALNTGDSDTFTLSIE